MEGKLFFSKLQGAGNDFIIFNNINGEIPEEKISAMAKRLCTRMLSIGADGFLLVERAKRGGDMFVRVFNADGSESEMCGNGMRCIGRYAYEEGLAGNHITIETVAGAVEALRLDRRLYRIRLPDPSVVKEHCSINVNGKNYEYAYVELGNPGIPHIVIEEPSLTSAAANGADRSALRDLARTLRYHKNFPKGTNVNFFRIREADGPVTGVDLLSYERGVEDFTLACGTGSGSTALSLKLWGRIPGNTVHLFVPGGVLVIDLKGADNGPYELYLTGDTNYIARGEILDDDWKE
jgi:diaminopimelate epimerase